MLWIIHVQVLSFTVICPKQHLSYLPAQKISLPTSLHTTTSFSFWKSITETYAFLRGHPEEHLAIFRRRTIISRAQLRQLRPNSVAKLDVRTYTETHAGGITAGYPISRTPWRRWFQVVVSIVPRVDKMIVAHLFPGGARLQRAAAAAATTTTRPTRLPVISYVSAEY